MSISVLGIDIGKNNFHLFGVDAEGKKVFRKKLTREKLTEFIPTLEPSLIVMEACGGAHYWARYFQSCDHQVKLIAPQYVRMYVKTNKTEQPPAKAGGFVLRTKVRIRVKDAFVNVPP